MSSIDSSGAVDGSRIRRRAAQLVRDERMEIGELVSHHQEQFEVPERAIRSELNKCFDAGLLYRTGEADSAEVRSP